MAERFLVSKVLISLDTLVFSSLETVDSFDWVCLLPLPIISEVIKEPVDYFMQLIDTNQNKNRFIKKVRMKVDLYLRNYNETSKHNFREYVHRHSLNYMWAYLCANQWM
jgi:hypothetical protein